MRKIDNESLALLEGGADCQSAGWMLGLGLFFSANPITALGGGLLLGASATYLVLNDCPMS